MPPVKKGFDFWKQDLNGARYVVAPMVDQSELAWRLLSRRHGAQLCYTPMLHASIFVRDARYRRENLVSCAEDRPLIVQFCANDPDTFLEAAKLVVGQCDAVDLNLGCPQTIAKKGHYGAYLQDEWDLVYKMVNTVYVHLNVPVTCKIRIFEDIDKSVRYAKMLEEAGCQLLAVHGRTREQKGPHTGIASWDHIKAIKKSVNIPVIANGNIQYVGDVDRCLRETNTDGIMIAGNFWFLGFGRSAGIRNLYERLRIYIRKPEGSLYNPTLLEGTHPKVWDVALEYLALVNEHPCSMSYVRGHLFKLLHHCLLMAENKEIQEELAKAGNLETFTSIIIKLRNQFPHCDVSPSKDHDLPFQLPLPSYICQPYVRPGPVELNRIHDNSHKSNVDDGGNVKRNREGSANELSRRKLKKLLRNPLKKFKTATEYVLCTKCCNPRGTKCSRSLCRACCRSLCRSENLDCYGHKILYKHRHLQIVSNNSARQIEDCC